MDRKRAACHSGALTGEVCHWYKKALDQLTGIGSMIDVMLLEIVKAGRGILLILCLEWSKPAFHAVEFTSSVRA